MFSRIPIKHISVGMMVSILFVSSYTSAQSANTNTNTTSSHYSTKSNALNAADIALSIGKRIKENNLYADKVIVNSKVISDKSLAETIKNLHDSFFRLNGLSYEKLLNEFEAQSEVSNHLDHAVSIKFFRGLVPYSQTIEIENKFPEIITYLENQTTQTDWLVTSIARYFLTYISTLEGDFNNAIQTSNVAFSTLPDGISDNANQMRILFTERMAHLHARLRDPLLTAENINRLIQLQIEAGQQVDGRMHLNNLIYVFFHWRDHETTQQLAQILIDSEISNNTDTPGLSYMRLAQAMSEKSNFKESLDLSNRGLEVVQNETLRTGLTALRITGLAGAGQVDLAKMELAEFRSKLKEGPPPSETLQAYLIYADALIAFGEGDIQLGQKLMTRRMDKYIQSTLRLSNKSTTELIATLENSKSRQMERQNALRREAELREAELKQKTFTNYLLIALSAILSIAALLSGLFARYRSRSASRLLIARDQAKAGEKAKTEFLAIMSHELRTPLNGIIGIADLLATTAPTANLRQKNNIILQSGNDLLALVESILDMSRIEAGEMGVDHDFVDVRNVLETLDQLWRPVITKAGVVLTTFVDDSVPDLFNTDEKRMRQCINNLMSNAAKFTKSGRIHIHVTATPANVRGEMVLSLIVADTGTGIREEVLGRLFQPFVQADASITRNYGGAGLGLAITRSLARMLGGDVHVVSREGRGSEFTLTFQGAYSQVQKEPDSTEIPQIGLNHAKPVPSTLDLSADDNVIPLTPVIPAPLAPIENGLFSGLRLLIVEDVISNQDIIQIFLRPLGCQFVTANNGIEALRALENYEFDVILMDIRMPEMDGIEATRRIRAHEKAFRNIPIIALTADKTEETQTLCKAAGIDLFLTKPVISKDLISAVRFVIEHPPRQAEASVMTNSTLTNINLD